MIKGNLDEREERRSSRNLREIKGRTCVWEDVYISVITRREWTYRLETTFSPHFSYPISQPIALTGTPFYRSKVTPHSFQSSSSNTHLTSPSMTLGISGISSSLAYVPLLCSVKLEKIEVEVTTHGKIGKIMLSDTGFRGGIILHSEQILVNWPLDGITRTNSYSLFFPFNVEKKALNLYHCTFTGIRKSWCDETFQFLID